MMNCRAIIFLFCMSFFFRDSVGQALPCTRKLDLILVMPTPADDTSWLQVKQFFVGVVTSMTVNSSSVQVALVTYRGDAIYQFGFSQYQTTADVGNAINNVNRINTKGSSLAEAMQIAINNIFLAGAYRSDAVSVMLGVVDEPPTSSSLTQHQTLLDLGVQTYMVMFSPNISVFTLTYYPTDYWAIYGGYSSLSFNQLSITTSICIATQSLRPIIVNLTCSSTAYITETSNNLEKSWLIAITDKQTILALNITSLILNSTPDYIYVYDGYSSAFPQIASFTLNQLPSVVFSSQAYLFVRLRFWNNNAVKAVNAVITSTRVCWTVEINLTGSSATYGTSYTCSSLGPKPSRYVMTAVMGTAKVVTSLPTITVPPTYYGTIQITCFVTVETSSDTECNSATTSITANTNYCQKGVEITTADGIIRQAQYFTYTLSDYAASSLVRWKIGYNGSFTSTHSVSSGIILPLNVIGPFNLSMTLYALCTLSAPTYFGTVVGCQYASVTINPVTGPTVLIGNTFTCSSAGALTYQWVGTMGNRTVNVAKQTISISTPGFFNLSCIVTRYTTTNATCIDWSTNLYGVAISPTCASPLSTISSFMTTVSTKTGGMNESTLPNDCTSTTTDSKINIPVIVLAVLLGLSVIFNVVLLAIVLVSKCRHSPKTDTNKLGKSKNGNSSKASGRPSSFENSYANTDAVAAEEVYVDAGASIDDNYNQTDLYEAVDNKSQKPVRYQNFKR